jgi:hypothetical protein
MGNLLAFKTDRLLSSILTDHRCGLSDSAMHEAVDERGDAGKAPGATTLPLPLPVNGMEADSSAGRGKAGAMCRSSVSSTPPRVEEQPFMVQQSTSTRTLRAAEYGTGGYLVPTSTFRPAAHSLYASAPPNRSLQRACSLPAVAAR